MDAAPVREQRHLDTDVPRALTTRSERGSRRSGGSGEAAPAGKTSSKKSANGDAHSSQTEKMKTCNQEAAAKKLHGDDRRHFMSECLKSDKKS